MDHQRNQEQIKKIPGDKWEQNHKIYGMQQKQFPEGSL